MEFTNIIQFDSTGSYLFVHVVCLKPFIHSFAHELLELRIYVKRLFIHTLQKYN